MNWKILGSALLFLIMGIFLIRQGYFPYKGTPLDRVSKIRGIILGPVCIIGFIIIIVKACSGDPVNF